MNSVLDVGCGKKGVFIGHRYTGWRHVRLDIDPALEPDVLIDARLLHTLPAEEYDAVYCSHNLEHYHRHDAAKVIQGMAHVLKPDGFVEIHVPNIMKVMQQTIERGLDVDDVLYEFRGGPILVRDVIYGYHVEIERSGNDFFAHKTAFSDKSLARLLAECGFPSVAVGPNLQPNTVFDLMAVAFKTPQPKQAWTRFGITAS